MKKNVLLLVIMALFASCTDEQPVCDQTKGSDEYCVMRIIKAEDSQKVHDERSENIEVVDTIEIY